MSFSKSLSLFVGCATLLGLTAVAGATETVNAKAVMQHRQLIRTEVQRRMMQRRVVQVRRLARIQAAQKRIVANQAR